MFDGIWTCPRNNNNNNDDEQTNKQKNASKAALVVLPIAPTCHSFVPRTRSPTPEHAKVPIA